MKKKTFEKKLYISIKQTKKKEKYTYTHVYIYTYIYVYNKYICKRLFVE